jgi:hypothetical protein
MCVIMTVRRIHCHRCARRSEFNIIQADDQLQQLYQYDFEFGLLNNVVI